jgi:oligopeptide transport system substrate-binding protein
MRRFFPVCCLVALALLGCTRHETPVQAALRTKTLYVGNFAEPRDLDPQVISIATDFNIAVALFEGLLSFDEATAQPVPAVAERWEISADRLTYTFHLRADARWSNGDPVTAHDFAYSFQRILTPAFAAEYANMLWPIKNAQAFTAGTLKEFSSVGVTALDDRTLRLTLERPTPHLLALAAHVSWSPVHRATIEKFGRMEQKSTAWTRPGNLVSNGAFTLAEWRPNSLIKVVKNPRYWGAATNRLDAVVFRPIENVDSEERDYRAGQLHVTWAVPGQKIAGYRTQPATSLRVEPGLRSSYLIINTERAPFNNPAIRRALSLALDRKALAQTVGYGVWTPAATLVPPGCGDYHAPAGTTEDLAEARRLLAAAGYPASRGFPSLPLTIDIDAVSLKLAEVLQARWQKELGITCTIESAEQKILFQSINSRAYVAASIGWIADFPDPTTFLDLARTGNGNNHTGWSHAAYDALLQRAEQTTGATRNQLLQQAEAILLQELPVIPLYFSPKVRLVHPTVRHWQPSPLDIHRYHLLDLQP